MDKTLISSLIYVQYLPINVSDHAAVILDLHFDRKPKQFRFWRLDPLLLRDEKFCKLISDSISNKNVETSLLWDTLKAFLSGKIISFSSHANKQRRKRKEELQKLISDIDRSLATTNDSDKYKERLKLKTELDLLLTTEAERLLLRSYGSLYEHGDKAGRLLAHQLKARQASNQIRSEKNREQ